VSVPSVARGGRLHSLSGDSLEINNEYNVTKMKNTDLTSRSFMKLPPNIVTVEDNYDMIIP
jgi:hypothetical protein